MFGRQKKELAALRAQIQDIAQAVSTLAAAREPAVNAGINAIATAAIEQRAKEMESLGGFLRVVSEIGTERAARALGRRRASTAKRRPDGKFLPKNRRPECRLCDNPALIDPTSDEIRAHAGHGTSGRPIPPAITYTHEPGRVVAHVHEDHIDQGADGVEQIDCPDCAPPAGRISTLPAGSKWN